MAVFPAVKAWVAAEPNTNAPLFGVGAAVLAGGGGAEDSVPPSVPPRALRLEASPGGAGVEGSADMASSSLSASCSPCGFRGGPNEKAGLRGRGAAPAPVKSVLCDGSGLWAPKPNTPETPVVNPPTPLLAPSGCGPCGACAPPPNVNRPGFPSPPCGSAGAG